jgi:hypothetical protein
MIYDLKLVSVGDSDKLFACECSLKWLLYTTVQAPLSEVATRVVSYAWKPKVSYSVHKNFIAFRLKSVEYIP